MKTDIKNILIPIDFSDTSLNALNTAINMAKRHEAILHILYVQDISDFYPQLGQLATIEPMLDEVFEKDKFLLERMVKSIYFDYLISCQLHLETGNRVNVIADTANAHNADVVVIGTDADIKERNYLEDSLPYKVLRKTKCHVLTVPAERQINAFNRIVFPVMGDEKPMEKLQLARSIIERNNAAVSIVGIVKKQELDLIRSIRKLSDRIKTRMQRFTYKASKRSVYSISPAKDISAISNKEKAQLVVIDGNTRRSFKEFFLGNFTQRMIHNDRVAVLMVKPPIHG